MATRTPKRKFEITVTTVPDKAPSLRMYYPNLDATDRVLICRALNEYRERSVNLNLGSSSDPGPVAHLGLLPFFSMRRVGTALTWMAATVVQNKRIWADLCAKVEAPRWCRDDCPERVSIHLVLNDALVHKHFGARPELGVQVPVIPNETTRGPLRWNIGAKEWLPEKISAAPRISMTKGQRTLTKGKSRWVIHMPSRYEVLVIQWLQDHC